MFWVKLWRGLLGAGLSIALICLMFLLNFTAPNPTTRRFSSEPVVTTSQTDFRSAGQDAERVLGNDLRLPHNTDQCVCMQGQPSPGQCHACLATIESASGAAYRLPDFVGADFLAESKNEQNFLYTGRERDQISDFVTAARSLRRPLWVYVRVDTAVDPQFTDLVHSTGGRVVRYFTIAGYVDPVEQSALYGLIISITLLGVMGVTGLTWRVLAGDRVTIPSRSPRPGAVVRAIRRLDAAEALARRAKRRIYRNMDKG